VLNAYAICDYMAPALPPDHPDCGVRFSMLFPRQSTRPSLLISVTSPEERLYICDEKRINRLHFDHVIHDETWRAATWLLKITHAEWLEVSKFITLHDSENTTSLSTMQLIFPFLSNGKVIWRPVIKGWEIVALAEDDGSFRPCQPRLCQLPAPII